MQYQSLGKLQPESLEALSEAEQFLIRAFRRWVLGLKQNSAGHWAVVWNDFAKRLGATEGKEALSRFAGLIKELQIYSIRPLRYCTPCCCVGADELAIAQFVAAGQRGEWSLARSLAGFLVKSDGLAGLLESGARLSAAFSRQALTLPARTCQEVSTVH